MTLVIFREVGLEIGPILASAGILGLAVGFGAQNLVRDFIAGFFMILENQIRVGDVAIINSTGGLVEQINFRTTVLRDLQGVVHYFQNGNISSLSNMTNDWSAYVFDIGVAYKENTDDVAIKIQQVIDSMMADDKFKNLIIDQPEIFGVDKLDNSAVVIKGRIKTLPIQQWTVGREFLRRIKFAFDEANIEIPFPHSTIYFGEDSKPFDVAMMQSKSEINLDAPDKS
jgi:small-conductance mechanosensitive channel